jgi:hypothetical protein
MSSPKAFELPAIGLFGELIHREAMRRARQGDDAVSYLIEECG